MKKDYNIVDKIFEKTLGKFNVKPRDEIFDKAIRAYELKKYNFWKRLIYLSSITLFILVSLTGYYFQTFSIRTNDFRQNQTDNFIEIGLNNVSASEKIATEENNINFYEEQDKKVLSEEGLTLNKIRNSEKLNDEEEVLSVGETNELSDKLQPSENDKTYTKNILQPFYLNKIINPISYYYKPENKYCFTDFYEKLQKKWLFSFEVFTTKTMGFKQQILDTTRADAKQNSYVITADAFSIGTLFGLHKKSFSAYIGAMYSQPQQRLNYGLQPYKEHQTYTFLYNGKTYDFERNGKYYQIDSSKYWHYVFVYTNRIQKADSTLAYKIDTSEVDVFDTTITNLIYYADLSSVRTTYSLIEFPIMVSYTKYARYVPIEIYAGLIPSFLITKKTIQPIDINTLQLPQQNIITHKFTLYGNLVIKTFYHLNQNLLLTFGPDFRYLINNDENQKFKIIANVNVGLKYYFFTGNLFKNNCY